MSRWYWKIGRYALPYARTLVVILALMLIGVGIGLLSPWPLKLLVDHVLPGKPLPSSVAVLGELPGAADAKGLVAWLAMITVVLFLARRLVKIASAYLVTGAATRMVYDLATELFHHLQRRSLLFHGRQRTGDLVKRITADTRCVRELVIDVCVPAVTSLATLAGMVVIMWRLDYRLAALAALVAIPLGAITRVFAARMAERSYRERELQGQLASFAEQTLVAIPVVQAFGGESRGDRHYRELALATSRANNRAVLSQVQFTVSTSAMTTAAGTAVMTIGGFYVLGGSLSVGNLLVLISYFAALYSPLETLAYLSQSFASAAAGARRVLEVLEADDDGVMEGARALPPSPDGRGGHLRFEHVSFGYRPGEPVLRDLTLDVQPGETLALVGRTGAGKSTLAALIPRFYDPWQGSIRLDGFDLREVQLKSLRSQIAIVLQEPYLLPLTIAENIAYGRPGAGWAEIEAAARAANANDFIEALPAGYDTVIGPRGTTLSGGERQRLAIARALLMDARILILDEPTASLDGQTEASILDELAVLTRGRTTLIIAHRLSTVARAGRIIVLDGGRIIETGSHAELSAAGGHYADLIRRRSLGDDDETAASRLTAKGRVGQ